MPAHAHLAGIAREEPAFEVAGPLRDHLDAVLRAPMSREQRAAVRALLRCRTAQLGGHLDTCTACGFARPSYNSCRDRHYGLLASGNVTTRLELARVLLGGGVAERDAQLNEQDSGPNESCAELLEAVAAVDVALCPSCGAHAVQRGPLPSPRPLGARAPPEVAA